MAGKGDKWRKGTNWKKYWESDIWENLKKGKNDEKEHTEEDTEEDNKEICHQKSIQSEIS